MKTWTKEKIEEAASFSWILYNKDDKPMVDGGSTRMWTEITIIYKIEV